MKLTIFAIISIIKFLSLFLSIFANHCTEDYEKALKSTKPWECCEYPCIAPQYHPKIRECQDKCGDEYCCAKDCIFNTLELFVDGKFQGKNLENLLLNDTDEEYQQSWRGIVGKSIEKCENLMDWKRDERYQCEIPVYAYFIFACIYQENFLSCPTFNSTEICNGVVEYLKNEPCGYLDGEKRIVGVGFFGI